MEQGSTGGEIEFVSVEMPKEYLGVLKSCIELTALEVHFDEKQERKADHEETMIVLSRLARIIEEAIEKYG